MSKPTHEDGNFIDKKENKEAENKTTDEKKIEEVLEDIIIKNAEEGVKPKNKKERSLDHEDGGLEENLEEINKKIQEDKDLWDVKEGVEEPIINEAESSAHKSFIHRMKLGKGRNKRKLGAMTLSNKEKAVDSLSYAEAVKRHRADSKDDNGLSR